MKAPVKNLLVWLVAVTAMYAVAWGWAALKGGTPSRAQLIGLGVTATGLLIVAVLRR